MFQYTTHNTELYCEAHDVTLCKIQALNMFTYHATLLTQGNAQIWNAGVVNIVSYVK